MPRPAVPGGTGDAGRSASWGMLAALVLGSHAAGALGALSTDPAFYRALERPGWAPPPWLFGPVWLTLYTAMGVAAWLVWRTGPGAARAAALRAFAAQWVLNAAWSPVFFGARQLGAALVVIVALEVAVLVTAARFHARSRVAALLMLPYAAWVGFAGALNAALWWLARA